MLFLNPEKAGTQAPDQKTQDLMKKTVQFFEKKGLEGIKEDDQASEWYEDFIHFLAEENVLATLLTPAGYGDEDTRFDLSRMCDFSELTAFYGLSYQYCFQVSLLGLSPIWMSGNDTLKNKTARLLKEGGIFAFGMSEKKHGADLYSNQMKLYPAENGSYRASGSKYYIGNANKAALVSVFGRMADTDGFVFFTADPEDEHYKLQKKIHTSGVRPAFVGEFSLKDYPVTEDDILSKGRDAWDASLSTVNIGKFQLGFASAGICQHAFYEALNHADNRVLYGQKVTDFSHVKHLFTESYARITAMKLYALRAVDYFRSSSEKDRRYLLFNPIQKMKVTKQGMEVIDMLLDVVAAKGFEQDTYMEMAIRDIGMIPRLEGTSHVNMALVIKFMENYFFNEEEFEDIPVRREAKDDSNLFNQTTGKLASVTFPYYRKSYEGVSLPNVLIFLEQTDLFREMLYKAPPTEQQQKDHNFMLHLGELFTMAVYAQLVLENARLHKVNDDLTDYMFTFMVGDFAQFALAHLSQFDLTGDQETYLEKMLKRPHKNSSRDQRIWEELVLPLKSSYGVKTGSAE
ncbi:acyl-CoA dehydrogenase [Salipaludibacillus aurantiacus]|uniref:Acyl-CoA dehydrogenase n=1 Tax=Salipaludibacillus aurantiacus TaxID=1601833 RepID=A0A1H9SB06_9BACI|nr:acyl-CoA dehydrogenase [Salipaludibacillus aurantiacus]SER81553.1 acyl-CoA dehydrogenase [Salipaludibacillus aurantiacus]